MLIADPLVKSNIEFALAYKILIGFFLFYFDLILS